MENYTTFQERLAKFQNDLRNQHTSYIVQRYTTFGSSFILNETEYFELRSEISQHFQIHPSEVIMVGSGKLGFSIKPAKRYIPFGEESDIDMAIISPNLFDVIWRQALEYSLNGDFWYFENERQFKDYLFQGWIRPDKLPKTQKFKDTQDWWEFFRSLTNRSTYKITGGLYKSWYHFELYQSDAVNACKQKLETW